MKEFIFCIDSSDWNQIKVGHSYQLLRENEVTFTIINSNDVRLPYPKELFVRYSAEVVNSLLFDLVVDEA